MKFRNIFIASFSVISLAIINCKSTTNNKKKTASDQQALAAMCANYYQQAPIGYGMNGGYNGGFNGGMNGGAISPYLPGGNLYQTQPGYYQPPVGYMPMQNTPAYCLPSSNYSAMGGVFYPSYDPMNPLVNPAAGNYQPTPYTSTTALTVEPFPGLKLSDCFHLF